MRRFLTVLTAGVVLATPALAQKPPKRDRFKITTEELAEYKNSDLIEVISKARPHFFQFNAGSTSGMAEATMQGQAAQLLVYVGQQSFGDTSVLRHHKASDTKEIRYLRPSDAMVRLGANNAAVIQIIPVPVKQ
jgi:hypothetical protein